MSNPSVPRRTALGAIAAGLLGTGMAANAGETRSKTDRPILASANNAQTGAKLKGRIKQSVSKWCFGKIPMEEFAKTCKEIGIVGIDLVGPDEWPTIKKHGLVPTMVPGAASIRDGLSHKENHQKCLADFKTNIAAAAKNGLPNVITFSGERHGMSDEEGLDNSVLVAKEAVKQAEDLGVTICIELLNSKVDHKDYMCDHTAWGAELCKRVGSPRFKLLYDIYHMQIMEGDIIRTIRDNIEYIGHFHTGGNPGRNEIDTTQELWYPPIMEAIVETGFDGYVAHEFVPKRDPITSLREAVALCDV